LFDDQFSLAAKKGGQTVTMNYFPSMNSRLALASLAFLSLAFASCSDNQRRIYIVTNCDKLEKISKDSVLEVTLSEPGLYTHSQELELEAKALVLVSDGQRHRYAVGKPGKYLLNDSKDTLLSNPADYVRDMFPGMNVSPYTMPRSFGNNTPTGNSKADSMVSRLNRAQEAAQERKKKDRLEQGYTEVQTILPGEMTFISAHEKAKLFILSDAPKQVEVKQGSTVEYYEINTYRYWMDRVMRELEEQNEGGRRRRAVGSY
jgi:hypothetical protein